MSAGRIVCVWGGVVSGASHFSYHWLKCGELHFPLWICAITLVRVFLVSFFDFIPFCSACHVIRFNLSKFPLYPVCSCISLRPCHSAYLISNRISFARCACRRWRFSLTLFSRGLAILQEAVATGPFVYLFTTGIRCASVLVWERELPICWPDCQLFLIWC